MFIFIALCGNGCWLMSEAGDDWADEIGCHSASYRCICMSWSIGIILWFRFAMMSGTKYCRRLVTSVEGGIRCDRCPS
jgi:hypothetical protein